MLKKDQVLDILNDGGYIMISEIYETATAYNLAGARIDTCRIDTARKISRLDGYTAESCGAWSYTLFISNPEIRKEKIAAAAEELDAITTPGHIGIQAAADHCIDGVRIPTGRRFLIPVYGNGSHGCPGNAYGNIYGFRSDKHAHFYKITGFKPNF